MSAQWFNPMTDTPEGLLLGDIQDLLKEVRNKKKADLNKDGKLSGYEKKRAKAIEASMAKQGYKSDRGQKPAPKMPTPKGNKTKIDKTTEILIELGVIKNDDKNTNCSPMCKNVDCINCEDSDFNKADMGEKNKYCQKHFGCSYSECTSKQKAQCDRECGKEVSKADMDEKNKYCQKHFGCNYSECTPKQKEQCNRECGKELKKYSQEPSVENLFPRFQNVDGGIPVNAHGFTTRGTYPATNDGPKKSIVSETAKMPAFAKTEYTPKGSSLHMHYNDAGGTRANGPNIDTIEQRLASLTKHAGRNNLGMIGEIESLIKQVKDKMPKKNEDDDSNMKIFAQIMGGGDRDKAFKNYETYRRLEREGKLSDKPKKDD